MSTFRRKLCPVDLAEKIKTHLDSAPVVAPGSVEAVPNHFFKVSRRLLWMMPAALIILAIAWFLRPTLIGIPVAIFCVRYVKSQLCEAKRCEPPRHHDGDCGAAHCGGGCRHHSGPARGLDRPGSHFAH